MAVTDLKLRILYLMDIMLERTDDAHALSAAQLIRILEQAGVNVTVRRKLGSDVDASCGQLRKKVADHRA